MVFEFEHLNFFVAKHNFFFLLTETGSGKAFGGQQFVFCITLVWEMLLFWSRGGCARCCIKQLEDLGEGRVVVVESMMKSCQLCVELKAELKWTFWTFCLVGQGGHGRKTISFEKLGLHCFSNLRSRPNVGGITLILFLEINRKYQSTLQVVKVWWKFVSVVWICIMMCYTKIKSHYLGV